MSIKKLSFLIILGAFFMPAISDGAIFDSAGNKVFIGACPAGGGGVCALTSTKPEPIKEPEIEEQTRNTESNLSTKDEERIARLTEQVKVLMAIVAQLQEQLSNM